MKKDHPEIPIGPYCYRTVGIIDHPKFGRIPSTQACPHWQAVECTVGGNVVRARCNLMDIEDDVACSAGLLWDQCKCCGINDPDIEGEFPDSND